MANRNTLLTGQASEQYACRFLEKHGLRLLAKNYRCKVGEIDLIMQDGDDVVFVEVRTRNQIEFGSAVESVNFHKQKKIIKAATHYLLTKNWFDNINSRFDIISISQGGCEWFKNAFLVE